MAKKAAVKVRQVLAEIQRDELMKVPSVVYEHELPILAAIHGQEMVRVIDLGPDAKRHNKQVTIEADASEEYQRLCRKYDTNRDKFVHLVYGRNPSLLAQATGLPYTPLRVGEMPVQPEQSVQSYGDEPEAEAA